MEQKTIETVSKLYEEKSNVYRELSRIIDENYIFVIGYKYKDVFTHGATSLNSLSLDFKEKIKEKSIKHLQNRLKEIDEQLEKL